MPKNPKTTMPQRETSHHIKERLLIVATPLFLVAALSTYVVYRSLSGSRIAAHETSMTSALRTINLAQVVYGSAYPKEGFSCNLAFLGPPSNGVPNASAAGLIDTALAGGMKSGYRIKVLEPCKRKNGVVVSYRVIAIPEHIYADAKVFCTDETGIIRFYDKVGDAMACFTNGHSLM
jgi:hypothetical protein